MYDYLLHCEDSCIGAEGAAQVFSFQPCLFFVVGLDQKAHLLAAVTYTDVMPLAVEQTGFVVRDIYPPTLKGQDPIVSLIVAAKSFGLKVASTSRNCSKVIPRCRNPPWQKRKAYRSRTSSRKATGMLGTVDEIGNSRKSGPLYFSPMILKRFASIGLFWTAGNCEGLASGDTLVSSQNSSSTIRDGRDHALWIAKIAPIDSVDRQN